MQTFNGKPYHTAPVTEAQLQGFVDAAQKAQDAYLTADQKSWGWKYTVAIEPNGRKFTKISIDRAGQKSVFCFIRMEDGAIMKPESWKKPAIHPRGNINTPTFGVEFLGNYGPAYLR